MKDLRLYRGTMIIMVLFFVVWSSLHASTAHAENTIDASKTNAQYSGTKSKYEGYTDEQYFKQMVKVYYPDADTIDSTAWAWTIAGTLIAFLSILGFLIWIGGLLHHIYKVLKAKRRLGDGLYWKNAGFYLLIILLSFSGGLGTIIISWYKFVHQSGGA